MVETTHAKPGLHALLAVLFLVLLASSCSAVEDVLERVGIGGEGGLLASGDREPARLGIIDDSVTHRASAAEDFAAARDGQALGVGDVLRTDDTGFAEIAYGDGSLTRLDYDTEFVIDELATGPLQVKGTMDTGRTWHRVKDIAGTGGSFEIESEVGVAAVRGTAFVVGCRDQICEFAVVEGQIEVTLNTGEVFTLEAGGVLVVGTDGTIVGQRQLVEGDRLVRWIRKNVEADHHRDRDHFPVPDLAPRLGIAVVAIDRPDDGDDPPPPDAPSDPVEPAEPSDPDPPSDDGETPPPAETSTPEPTPPDDDTPAEPPPSAQAVKINEYGIASPGGALAIVKGNGTAEPGDALAVVIASGAGSATVNVTADGSGRWSFEEAGSAPDGDITITVRRSGGDPSEDRATVVKSQPPGGGVTIVGHSYRRDNRQWIGLVVVPDGTQPGDVTATVGNCGSNPTVQQGGSYWTVTVNAGGCSIGRHGATVTVGGASHTVTVVTSASPS